MTLVGARTDGKYAVHMIDSVEGMVTQRKMMTVHQLEEYERVVVHLVSVHSLGVD